MTFANSVFDPRKRFTRRSLSIIESATSTLQMRSIDRLPVTHRPDAEFA
jgi:hypothetical protein